MPYAGYLYYNEVADLCGVKPPTVWSWKHRGLLNPAALDDSGRPVFRQADAARCEAATRKKAGRKPRGLTA